MEVNIKFLGGALEVGKEGILLTNGITKILLDYGSTVSDEKPNFQNMSVHQKLKR